MLRMNVEGVVGMKRVNTFDNMPVGKYCDVATLYICQEEITRLTGIVFFDGCDNFDYHRQALIVERGEGVVLTQYRGFKGGECVMSINTASDDYGAYVKNMLRSFGIDPEEFHILLMSEAAEFLGK